MFMLMYMFMLRSTQLLLCIRLRHNLLLGFAHFRHLEVLFLQFLDLLLHDFFFIIEFIHQHLFPLFGLNIYIYIPSHQHPRSISTTISLGGCRGSSRWGCPSGTLRWPTFKRAPPPPSCVVGTPPTPPHPGLMVYRVCERSRGRRPLRPGIHGVVWIASRDPPSMCVHILQSHSCCRLLLHMNVRPRTLGSKIPSRPPFSCYEQGGRQLALRIFHIYIYPYIHTMKIR